MLRAIANDRETFTGTIIPEILSSTAFFALQGKHNVLNRICTDGIEGAEKLKKEGDTVLVPRVPIPTIVRNRPKGAKPDYQELKPIMEKYTVGRTEDYSFRVHKDDIAQFMAGFKNWALMLGNSGGQAMYKDIELDALASFVTEVAADNSGVTAGEVTHSLNLGTAGAPLTHATPDLFLDHIVDLAVIADEANWPPELRRYLLLTAKQMAKLKKSALRNTYVTGDDRSPILTGKVQTPLDGWELIQTNSLPRVGTVVANLFGCKGAHGWITQVKEMETFRSKDSPQDVYYNMHVLYDRWTLREEMAGVTYIND